MHPLGFIDGEHQDGEIRGRIFISGAANSGKTTEMIRMVRQCRGDVIFYDHGGDHSIPGFTVVHSIPELVAITRRNYSHGHFRVLYQAMWGEKITHFRSVCDVAFHVAGLVLAIDEIDSYCEPEFKRRLPPELYSLVHHGRHAPQIPGANLEHLRRRGVSMVYTARVPKSAAPDLRSQASEMRLFHEDENDNVDYFAKNIGSANGARLRTLPRFMYLHWFKTALTPVTICGGPRKKV